jgi:hypothetical protein
MTISGRDIDDIHLDSPGEERIFYALKTLMDALSGPRGDVVEACQKYLTRGFPGVSPPTTEGVILDLLVQSLWLAAKLHVDLEGELERLSGDFSAAAERMREDLRQRERMRHNRAALGGGLETPQGRCLTMLVYGVTLQPEPATSTWTWRRATFPDEVVRKLVEGGLAAIEGDGASSRYVAVTPRGMAAFEKLAGEEVAVDDAYADAYADIEAPVPAIAPGAEPPTIAFSDDDAAGPFRFT